MSKPKPSFWRLIGDALMLLGPVAKKGAPALLGLFFLHLLISQYDGLAATVIRERGREDVSLIAMTAMITVILQALWSAAMVLVTSLVAATVADSRMASGDASEHSALSSGFELGELFLERYPRLVIEGLRAMAAVIFRLPLLILPAMIEWVRLSLVQYVVILNPAYTRGEVDALMESRRLTQGRFWFLSSVYSVGPTFLLILYAFSGGESELLIWKKPIATLLIEAARFAIEFYAALLLYLTFQEITTGPIRRPES